MKRKRLTASELVSRVKANSARIHASAGKLPRGHSMRKILAGRIRLQRKGVRVT